jgi:transcriptional regulator with XRE-family HTH domain
VPAPKPDMNTVNGRLANARMRKDIDQEVFAEKLAYTLKGWQNIEQGQRGLSVDVLRKANEILELDYGYYFGQISYDEAVQRQSVDMSAVLSKLDDMQHSLPVYDQDPELNKLAMRLRANRDLREHTERLAYQPSDVIREIDSYAGYLMSTRDEESQTDHNTADLTKRREA